MCAVGCKWWLVVAVCIVVGTYLCLVASIVLLAMGLNKRFRGWVEGGVGRCSAWVCRLF